MGEGTEDEAGTGATPRGAAAPPIQQRRGSHRERLFDAGMAVFVRDGYAVASAEAIAKEAGMSKKTFYEHFSSKDELLFELFDKAAWTFIREITSAWTAGPPADTYEQHTSARIAALLNTLDEHPELAQIAFLEVQAAGEEGRERRDELIANFASASYYDNHEMAAKFGAPVYRERDDALVAIYAAIEMALRQIRLGQPETMDELVPLLTRLMFGALSTT
ncbi:MAG: TetR/AcrR family transcriptional regulator [Baekduia sp.]